MTTPAGQLDRRVQLRAPVVVRDSQCGSEQITYPVAATVWGRVTERASAMVGSGDRVIARRDITVRIRYRADVLPTWQVGVGGRTWRMAGAPLEVGRRQYLDLPCEEIDV